MTIFKTLTILVIFSSNSTFLNSHFHDFFIIPSFFPQHISSFQARFDHYQSSRPSIWKTMVRFDHVIMTSVLLSIFLVLKSIKPNPNQYKNVSCKQTTITSISNSNQIKMILSLIIQRATISIKTTQKKQK